MKDFLPNGEPFPEALDFFKWTWAVEDRCAKITDDQIPEMGVKAPQCLRQLGTVLSLLDRLATCYWGCSAGDHTIEYLAGRACSSGKATLRLLRFGFYDEALSVIRSIGEIANLLFLFDNDTESFLEWKTATERKRKSDFSPYMVRLKLEKLGIPLPADVERYSQLCEVGTHVTPKTKPQMHNSEGIPVLGGYFQDVVVLTILNEVAGAIASTTFAAVRLVDVDTERREHVVKEVIKLLDSTGGVVITNRSEIWSKLRTLGDG